jgi:hypothetical protein
VSSIPAVARDTVSARCLEVYKKDNTIVQIGFTRIALLTGHERLNMLIETEIVFTTLEDDFY